MQLETSLRVRDRRSRGRIVTERPRRRAIAETGPLPRVSRTCSRYERFVKPVVDRAVGGVLLLLTAPLIGLVTLAVWVRLGRPVLLRQDRIGLHGEPFGMYKFRTMEPDRRVAQRPFHGPERRRCHKTDADPRHTRMGRFLRKWSLDELPQLWNILAGHMSLVGPRPELTQIVDRYEAWQHRRHLVKPGLTGLWQVSERSNGTLMHEHVEIDLEYVERVSLRTDVAILIRTLPAALGLQRGR